MPYKEIQHTADWSLRVWAADLPGLFSECALGMQSLAGVRLAPSPRVKRFLEFSAADLESLLVSFLSELLYIQEQERLAFDQFSLQLENCTLSAELQGAHLLSMDKAIKAVTYHNLQVQKTSAGCTVEIVFDV